MEKIEKVEIKIGDKFKIRKKEYEVIGIFEENDEKFFWCRTTDYSGLTIYSNVFRYDTEGKLIKRT